MNSLSNRSASPLASAVCVSSAGAFGYLSWQELAIEAYPDIADTTAQVVTRVPRTRHSEEVEEQNHDSDRARAKRKPLDYSSCDRAVRFGLSLITLVFQDGIDDYFARQRIRERLTSVSLPRRVVEPELDPLTSPIGEIYRYTGKHFAQPTGAARAPALGGHFRCASSRDRRCDQLWR